MGGTKSNRMLFWLGLIYMICLSGLWRLRIRSGGMFLNVGRNHEDFQVIKVQQQEDQSLSTLEMPDQQNMSLEISGGEKSLSLEQDYHVQEEKEEEFIKHNCPENDEQIIIDMRYYRLRDPFYGLMDSSYSDEEILKILEKIISIWCKAGIHLRFSKREALEFVDIDLDRAKAYLFYVFGHPAVQPNPRMTQIRFAKDRDWVLTSYKDYLFSVLPHYMELRGSLLAIHILRNWQTFSFDADVDKDKKISQDEFVSWIQKNRKQFQFSEGFDPSMAFLSIAGEPSENKPFLTSACIEHSLREPMSNQISPIRLGFRKFYLDFNISVADISRFASKMTLKPMLFLHYSIGRDTFDNRLLRSEWSYRNTLQIYPVPYYHDMNGRGSTNWMDVVVRTSSCWSVLHREIQSPFVSKAYKVHCRFGVRWWEQHHATIDEFSRMVAHEIGHTLGLEHPDPKCKIYSSPETGELMQQQRVFALQQWVDEKLCKCVTPNRCGNCDCAFDSHPDMYQSISSAILLPPEHVEIARKSAAGRDSKEMARSTNTVGVTTQVIEHPDPTNGPLLSKDESIMFSMLPSPKTGYITRLRWKCSFIFPRSSSNDNIKLPIRWSTSKDSSVVYIDPSRFQAHYEHVFHKPLFISKGESINMSFVNSSSLVSGTRLRIAVIENLTTPILNFDLKQNLLL